MAAKVIALFNHKGGVGKTTLAYHLAYSLAEKGKTVTLVDADSQGNLTGIFAGFLENANNDKKIDDLFKASFDIKKHISLHEYLSPYLFLNENKVDKVPYRKSYENDPFSRIKLITGGIETAEFDLDLSDAIQRPTSRTSQHFPGAFQKAIHEIGSLDGESDFTILDLSPSLSIFNMLTVMSSDYFLVPVNPSYFSLQAVDSLIDVFKKWSNMLDPYTKYRLNDSGIDIKTKFLGLILQNYGKYDNENNKDGIVNAFNDWVKKVNQSAVSFAKSLYNTDKAILPEEFNAAFCTNENNVSPYIISKIPRFNRFSAMSETYGVPVSALNRNIISPPDQLNDGDLESIENFKILYSNIADGLIKLL